ncbi:hypothetical protein NDU88_011343 [Pleurodeles waltl]|uniref:Uncharacterized protein n=1 Tax=Pleurodeles waltl TaxID=8319 RepID=A0AAV7S3A4_PLEWA|nr:hypothetical protein NDU88_011343 [Pleurodeles waltl]
MHLFLGLIAPGSCAPSVEVTLRKELGPSRGLSAQLWLLGASVDSLPSSAAAGVGTCGHSAGQRTPLAKLAPSLKLLDRGAVPERGRKTCLEARCIQQTWRPQEDLAPGEADEPLHCLMRGWERKTDVSCCRGLA